ncbi:GGDEF domain-containing protein [Rhizobium sp. ARZ01]|uniref:GGDEF domain-containing protein n=1 Tax=Rhizobium sp. ARZ01 TaxID=2769313 RepID=UPI00177B4C3A|nr:GGDEF domain-containing protein [Rhizobium sp. ARZ01]MBD9372423.1 GGDEF domain-containing protein [Rhizobium sp. ARZ01]
MNAPPQCLNMWYSCEPVRLDRARETLSAVIAEHADRLIERFYEVFLRHEAASPFLDHSLVVERLSPALHRWLLSLANFDPTQDLETFKERQVKMGEAHARMKIPVYLVLEGASLIKSDIAVILLSNHGNSEGAMAFVLLNEIVDYAMLLMSQAYVTGVTQRAKIEEAYRLFTLGQDVNVERESQRAALMEWSQSTIFGLLGSAGSAAPKPIATSEFGLWFRHRASIMFQGSLMLNSIDTAMKNIDEELLPTIGGLDALHGPEGPPLIASLQARVEEIKFLLSDLFQSLSASAGGRDPLTSTLSRKFLPSILGREIAMCQQHGTPLAVMMVDADHFKKVNDTWGHAAGDTVLRQIAEIIADNTRSADIVFRYGGEEFLVALVETELDGALEVAEKVRAAVDNTEITVVDGAPIRATVSIGVATHLGHPDYQHLIKAADQALYRAKNEGRNRVAAA